MTYTVPGFMNLSVLCIIYKHLQKNKKEVKLWGSLILWTIHYDSIKILKQLLHFSS